ncbi:hypothetical protein QVA66_03605 [Staphylococcus chromogenes]|nr:hypothetical protein [Staphylococcus chromogenes]
MSAQKIFATVLLSSVAGVCAACAAQPQPVPHEAEYITIKVVADEENLEQQILGDLYTEALIRRGHESYVELTGKDASRISQLEEGRGDLAIGCTGEFLNRLNPSLAAELSAEYQAAKAAGIDPNDGTWRDKIYQAMVASLPDTLAASNPSNATGCANYAGPELPLNVVPIFRETALHRHNRDTMNIVSGSINDKDLRRLYGDTHDVLTARPRAVELLDSYGI